MLNAYGFSFLLLNHSNRLNRIEIICITFQYKKLSSCSSDLYSKSSLFKLFGAEEKNFFFFIKDSVINEHYVSKITHKRLIDFVNGL